MRHITEQQRQKSEERKAHFRDIIKTIAAMTDEQKEIMASRMPALVNTEGHTFSFHNTLLIASQGGINCTIVGGFKQWLKQGRAVKKGEHGYAILFPREKKEQDSENLTALDADKPEIRFLIGYVFDISQTLEIETTN